MTGRRIADPDRPTCHVCNRATSVYSMAGGVRWYRCNVCGRRGTAAQFAEIGSQVDAADGTLWAGMEIVEVLPPAIQVRKNQCCEMRRSDGHVYRCQYLRDCEENTRRGGAALCELCFVEICGAERVVW